MMGAVVIPPCVYEHNCPHHSLLFKACVLGGGALCAVLAVLLVMWWCSR